MREKILQAIIDYIEEHQYPPTNREIAEMVGIKSTSTVAWHLTRLMRDGLIETDSGDCSARAIRVPGYKLVKVD